MRAMILAAGRGKRMKQLTNDKPKALLKLAGHYLIEYPLHALIKMGVKDIVINVCYHPEQIKNALGNGARYGVNIEYSDEASALETGGGILKALPLLGKEPFIVLACDIVSDYPLQNLPKNPEKLAHLVLVDNPVFYPRGDFGLQGNEVIISHEKTLTFGSIGIYRPELFANCSPGRFRLGDLLNEAIKKGLVTGEHHQGFWHNLGTPAQLENIGAVPDNLLANHF